MVEGTGEPDPLEPEKQYDDKGRIINPETKKIIKDVIRSHNEVMHVIGVAEPDADAAAKTASDEQREDYQDYEAETGRALLITGQVLGIMGNWGLHGIRQRLLVSHVALW